MIRDITIGQYYPAERRIHTLDPRVKIVCTLLFLVYLFVQNSLPGYVIATIYLACVIRLSRVPLKYILKGLKPVVILLLFTVVMNLFLTDGGEILVQFGIFTITENGLRTSVFMAVRLMYLVTGSSIMTFTTSPNGLTDGRYGFRVILLEETDKIMKSQQARGADFESGNIIQRAKAMVPILVPLFVSAFRRANDLAMAMESRCYHGGEGRTKMKPLHYHGRDRAAYFITLIYLVIMFVVGRFLPFKLWIF